MHLIRRSKRVLIYSTDREWLLLTVNAGSKLSSRRYEILDMKNENRAAMSMLNWDIVTFFSLYETCSSTYSLISWVNFSHFYNSCVVCLLVNFGAKSSSEKSLRRLMLFNEWSYRSTDIRRYYTRVWWSRSVSNPVLLIPTYIKTWDWCFQVVLRCFHALVLVFLLVFLLYVSS